MMGAIIGDIVGSRFEGTGLQKKDFDLFTQRSRATDDTIMTLAVAKSIMETVKTIELSENGTGSDDDFHRLLAKNAVLCMQKIGRKYPYAGYGGRFGGWLFTLDPKPYNSFGNGAAMRISPAGLAARSEQEAARLSKTITAVTHNHEEGLKGAEATAIAVYMANTGFSKDEIREKITKNYYPLNFTIDGIRPTFRFDVTCGGTVPQAVQCFLESESFEDAVRNAVSLGGDTDTLAAITGSIAGPFYGIPDDIRNTALTYLDDYLRAMYEEWETFIGKGSGPSGS